MNLELLLKLLRDLEWSTHGGFTWRCPKCGGRKADGHRVPCELADAIEFLESVKSGMLEAK